MAGTMKAVADTHAAIWYLWEPGKLSAKATQVMDESIEAGERVGLSSITLCEVVYLAEKGRIRPDAFGLLMEAVLAPDGLFEELSVDSATASAMSSIPRSAVPDMPDRIIAATALCRSVPLITKDRRIRDSGVPVVW